MVPSSSRVKQSGKISPDTFTSQKTWGTLILHTLRSHGRAQCSMVVRHSWFTVLTRIRLIRFLSHAFSDTQDCRAKFANMFTSVALHCMVPFINSATNFRCEHCTGLLQSVNLLKPTGHVMHQQFNIPQLYVLPTLYLCVLYLSENKQRLVPLTA